MMPILRISERGVVRAIAEFRRFQVKVRGGLEGRIKSRVFCHGRPRMSKKMRVLTAATPLGRRRTRTEGAANAAAAPAPLDAVSAAFQTGGLRSEVVRPVAGRRPTPGLSRVKPRLRRGPAMAFELVLAQLLLALTVLRIGDEFRRPRSLAAGSGSLAAGLIDDFCRWRHSFVLTDSAVPDVVIVVGVIIRNAAPPIGRVVIGKRREIKAQS